MSTREDNIGNGRDRRAPPQIVEGTSLSAPYIASVIALLINIDPDATPDELRQIVSDPRHFTPDPAREGAGMLDVVKAAKAARANRRWRSWNRGLARLTSPFRAP